MQGEFKKWLNGFTLTLILDNKIILEGQYPDMTDNIRGYRIKTLKGGDIETIL